MARALCSSGSQTRNSSKRMTRVHILSPPGILFQYVASIPPLVDIVQCGKYGKASITEEYVPQAPSASQAGESRLLIIYIFLWKAGQLHGHEGIVSGSTHFEKSRKVSRHGDDPYKQEPSPCPREDAAVLFKQRRKVAGWCCDGKGCGASLHCGREEGKVWDEDRTGFCILDRGLRLQHHTSRAHEWFRQQAKQQSRLKKSG